MNNDYNTKYESQIKTELDDVMPQVSKQARVFTLRNIPTHAIQAGIWIKMQYTHYSEFLQKHPTKDNSSSNHLTAYVQCTSFVKASALTT